MAHNTALFTLCEDGVLEFGERVTQIAFSPEGTTVLGKGGLASCVPHSLLAIARAGSNASSVLAVKDILPSGEVGVAIAPSAGPPYNSLRHLAWRPRNLYALDEKQRSDAASTSVSPTADESPAYVACVDGSVRADLDGDDSLLLSSLDTQAIYDWAVDPTSGAVRELSHTTYHGYEPIDVSYSADGRMKCIILCNERESRVKVMRAVAGEERRTDASWEVIHTIAFPIAERCVKRSFFGRRNRSLTLVSMRISAQSSTAAPSGGEGRQRPRWRPRAVPVPTSTAGGRNALVELLIATEETEWVPVPVAVDRPCKLNFPFDWYAAISIDATGDLGVGASVVRRSFPGDLRVAAAGGYGTFYIMDPADPSSAVTCHPPLLSRKCSVAWSPCGGILAVAGLGIGLSAGDRDGATGAPSGHRLRHRRDTLDYSAADTCLQMHLYLYDRHGNALASVDLGANGRPSERCYVAWDWSLFSHASNGANAADPSFHADSKDSPNARIPYPFRMAIAQGTKVSIVTATDHRPYLSDLGALCPVAPRALCNDETSDVGYGADPSLHVSQVSFMHKQMRSLGITSSPSLGYADVNVELPLGRRFRAHRLFLSRSSVLAAALRGDVATPPEFASDFSVSVSDATDCDGGRVLTLSSRLRCFGNDAAVDLLLRFLYTDALPFDMFRDAMRWGCDQTGLSVTEDEGDCEDAFDRTVEDCVRLFTLLRLWPLPEALPDHLSRCLATSEWADVGIGSAGEVVLAHKAILCARSDYFRALLGSNMGHVVSPKDMTSSSSSDGGNSLCRAMAVECADARSFAAVVRFMYTDWAKFGSIRDVPVRTHAPETHSPLPQPLSAEDAWAAVADMHAPPPLRDRAQLAVAPSFICDVLSVHEHEHMDTDGGVHFDAALHGGSGSRGCTQMTAVQFARTDAFGSVVSAAVEVAEMLGLLDFVAQCIPLLSPHVDAANYAEFASFALTRGDHPEAGAMRSLMHTCDDVVRRDVAGCLASVLAVSSADACSEGSSSLLRELLDRIGRISWRKHLVGSADVDCVLSSLDGLETSAAAYTEGPMWDAALDGLVRAYDSHCETSLVIPAVGSAPPRALSPATAAAALLFCCADVRKTRRDSVSVEGTLDATGGMSVAVGGVGMRLQGVMCFEAKRASLAVHDDDDHCDMCRQQFGQLTRRKKWCRCCHRKICARCSKRTRAKVHRESLALVVDIRAHTACRSCAALASFL